MSEKPVKLSAIIIARDEENNIRVCLESIKWIKEIIVVVDSRTTDRTEKIAREYTSHVFMVEWLGYAGSKNYALEQASGEWVLWLDADEVVSPSLEFEIQRVIHENEAYVGYEIPRLAYFVGRWIYHSGWYPGYVLRLFKREQARFKSVLVHEGVEIEGPIGRLRANIHHYTDRNIRHYFSKFNQFTSLAAEEMANQGKHFRVMDLIFRPFFIFIKMYFLRRGYFDGLQGFMLAVFSASYVFTKYAKLWELEQGFGRGTS